MLEERPEGTPLNKDEERRLIINKLSMTKAFTVSQQIKQADQMSREQAVELLKDLFVHIAHKDEVFNLLINS